MSNARKEGLEMYTNLLTDMGCRIDEDGSIHTYYRKGDKVGHRKMKIGDLQVVLPIPENLSRPEGEVIFFHPLAENSIAGESSVFRVLKKVANANLQTRFTHAIVSLGHLALNPPKKIPADLRGLLKGVVDFNPKAMEELSKLLKLQAPTPISRNIIGLYTRHRNAELDGKKFARVTEVSSSLLNELESGRNWGRTNMSKKASRAIQSLLNSVLPELNDGAYSVGSNDRDAPYFDSLTRAWLHVSERLAMVEEVLAPFQDAEVKAYMPNAPKHEWVGFTPLKLRKAWPAFSGNAGEVEVTNTISGEVNTSKVPMPTNEAGSAAPAAPGQPAPAAPASVPAAAPAASGNRWDNPAPTPNQQPQYGQPAPGGFGQPAQPVAQPQQSTNRWGVSTGGTGAPSGGGFGGGTNSMFG